MAVTYTRIQTANSDLNRVQDSVNTAVQAIVTGPFVGGTILNSVNVTTGVTQISHNLGYTPTTVFTGPTNVNCTLWSPKAPDASFIYLQSTSACVLSVWVK